MKSLTRALLVLVLLAGAGAAVFFWRRQLLITASNPLASAPKPPDQAPDASQPQYPVEPDETATSQAGNATSRPPSAPIHKSIEDDLVDLFGKDVVAGLFNTDDIIRRVVVTVDNLTGENAPNWSLSPLKSPDGDFLVDTRDGQTYIARKNDDRYGPFVAVAKEVDAEKLVAIYVHYYPRFQAAYRELGMGGYFNDRLVRVIDELLKTPDVKGPIKVVQPTPRNKYKFADDELENLSSGQKILLRLGPDSAKVIKEKLRRVRRLLVHLGARRHH